MAPFWYDDIFTLWQSTDTAPDWFFLYGFYIKKFQLNPLGLPYFADVYISSQYS